MNNLLHISKAKNFNSFSKFNFGAYGNFNLKRLKKKIFTDKTKDLTKNFYLNSQIERKVNEKKSTYNLKKLSSLISSSPKKLQRIGYNPFIKPNSHQLLNMFRNTNNMQFSYMTKRNKPNWSDMFRLDYTAQNLENIRRDKENKIFFRKEKQLHETQLGLRIESRKQKNILKNYGEFKDYEAYNNSNNSLSNNIYSLIDFFPEGSSKIGKSLEEENELYKEKKVIFNYDYRSNKYNQYIENKNKFNNIRIESLVNDKYKSNPKLKQLINSENKESLQLENHNYIDSISIKNEENSNKNINDMSVIKDNTSASILLNQKIYTLEMKTYEMEVYEKFRNMDLNNRYKSVNKRIEFKNLSTSELLNYIKFNIKDSKELFSILNQLIIDRKPNLNPAFQGIKLLKETSLSLYSKRDKQKKEDYHENHQELSPYVISSMIHKLGLTYKSQNHKYKSSLYNVYSYRLLLSLYKNNIQNLNFKHITDTIYSLSKLHEGNRDFSYMFFQSLLSDSYKEINNRVNIIINESQKIHNNDYSIPYINEISPGALSFLCQGLSGLKMLSSRNETFCLESFFSLSERMLTLLELLFSNKLKFNSSYVQLGFNYIEIGNILNFIYNDLLILTEGDVLESTNITKDRVLNLVLLSVNHVNLYLNDSYNDSYSEILPSNIVNITSVYSHAYYSMKLSMSVLNNNEEDYKIKMRTFQKILLNMSKIIFLKTEVLSISHASKILFDYTMTDIYIDDMYQVLNKRVKNQLESIEDYEVKDISYFVGGVSKFYLKDVFPNYSLDVLNIQYPIYNSVRETHARFSTFNIFTNYGSLINSLNKPTFQSKRKNVKKMNRAKRNIYKIRQKLREKIKNKVLDKVNKDFKPPNTQHLYTKMNEGNNIERVPFILYSMAMMGYKNDIFYNTSIQSLFLQSQNFNEGNELNNISFKKNIGYIFQTLAFLNDNNTVRTGFILNYLLENLSDIINLYNSEYIISQVLSSIFSLNLRKNINAHLLISDFNSLLNKFVNSKVLVKDQIGLDYNTSFQRNQLIITYILYNINDESFIENSIETYLNSLLTYNLSTFHKSILYLVLSKLERYNKKLENLSKVNFLNEFIQYENDRIDSLYHNSIENGYEIPLYQIFINLISKKKQFLEKKYNIKIEINHLLQSYIVLPIYISTSDFKLGLVFYDKSDCLIQSDLKGFSLLREEVIESENIRIERIIDNKDIRLMEQESKNNEKYLNIIECLIESHLNKENKN